jgi:hypothetical protein
MDMPRMRGRRGRTVLWVLVAVLPVVLVAVLVLFFKGII